jgi:hypothetical protein
MGSSRPLDLNGEIVCLEGKEGPCRARLVAYFWLEKGRGRTSTGSSQGLEIRLHHE